MFLNNQLQNGGMMKMSGKGIILVWTIGGAAMLFCIYMLGQAFVFFNSFAL
jgi:hypothetical protein